MNSNTKKLAFFLLIGFTAGAGTVGLLRFGNAGLVDKYLGKPPTTSIYDTNEGSKFIKPLLLTEYDSQDESLAWYPYEQKIKDEVQAEISRHPEIEVGFYYHDLSNLSWFGINENEKFIPASLLKLPMLISYYKLRESDPTIFDQTINYKGENFNDKKNLGQSNNIVPGGTYTVKHLLDEMIINSDNNALELLFAYKRDILKNLFDDLQTPLPEQSTELATDSYLSARDYGKFFLILYNASYLNRKDSEEVLEMLSKINFKDGLTGSLPDDVVVSHKFGERIIAGNGNDAIQEFHDCGIVYFPNKPYKICIMTKGHDLVKQQELVREISKIIYYRISVGAQANISNLFS